MSVDTIEKAIRSVLVADSAVKAITTRCYPATLPQDPTYPLILFSKVTGNRDHHLQGPSGLAHPRFQVEAWALTYDAAKALANAIRVALDGYAGTQGTVVIRSIIMDSERDFYEDAVSCHRVVMDFFTWHEE
jgi:hypothetical protein